MGRLKYIFITFFILAIPCFNANAITLEELAGKLKTAETLSEFTEEISKIDFAKVFLNKTTQAMVAPEYGKPYLMTLAKADNILDFVELPKARVDIQEGDGSFGSAMKSVLENIDVLKVVDRVDWSKFILRSNGSKSSQLYTL